MYECEEEKAINIYPKVEMVEGNPYYEEANGYSAASRTYYKLRSFVQRCTVEGKEKGVYLCRLVLTFPKELSKLYYEKGENKRQWQLFKKFWERMQEEFCLADEDGQIRERMGAVVSLHIWKTVEPVKPHYHIHTSFLNIVSRASSTSSDERSLFKGTLDKDGRRFSPKIDRGLLKWLKERWRMLLEEEGKSQFGKDYELENTDIYYDFVKLENGRKVLHTLKYQYRQWVVDFCDWSEENGYGGEIPGRMLGYRNRARVFGFWKKLGTDKETKEVLKELRSGKKRLCPFCGSITKKRGEESTEDIWRKLNNSEIEWYKYSKGIIRAKPPTELFFRYLCMPEGTSAMNSMCYMYHII